MRITIIGASAGLGLAALKEALDQGHEVTTLSRSKIPIEQNDKLRTITGSALNGDDLRQAIAGADAILVTLGTRQSRRKTTLFSDFARLMTSIGTDAALIVVTGFGTAPCLPYLSWYERIALKLVLGKVYHDKTLMENIISSSDMRWELVRPVIMSNRPLRATYRAETTLKKRAFIGTVSRASVAHYLVCEAQREHNIGRAVTLSNR